MTVAEIAVPAIPAIGAGAIALGACVIFAFLWAFDKAFRALFAPLLTKVANIGFGGIHGIGAVHPFGFLHAIVTSVEHWTNAGLAQSERAISWGFQAAWAIIAWTTFTTERLAGDLAQSASNLWHHAATAVPKIVRTTIVKPVTTGLHALEAKVATRFNSLTHELHALEAKVAHGAHVVAHAGAVTIPQLGRLEHEATRDAKRLTKLEKKFALPALGALTLAALARVGYGWIKCPNVGRFGKFLCGTPALLMDALLAALTLVIATEGIVPFAEQVQSVVSEFAPLIGKFWHASAIGQGGDRKLGDSTLTS